MSELTIDQQITEREEYRATLVLRRKEAAESSIVSSSNHSGVGWQKTNEDGMESISRQIKQVDEELFQLRRRKAGKSIFRTIKIDD